MCQEAKMWTWGIWVSKSLVLQSLLLLVWQAQRWMLQGECYFEGSWVPSCLPKCWICWVSLMIFFLYLLVSRNTCRRWRANLYVCCCSETGMLLASSDFIVAGGLGGFASLSEIYSVIPDLEGARADPVNDCSTVVNGMRITALGCLVLFGFNLQFRTILLKCTSFLWMNNLHSKGPCCFMSHKSYEVAQAIESVSFFSPVEVTLSTLMLRSSDRFYWPGNSWAFSC